MHQSFKHKLPSEVKSISNPKKGTKFKYVKRCTAEGHKSLQYNRWEGKLLFLASLQPFRKKKILPKQLLIINNADNGILPHTPHPSIPYTICPYILKAIKSAESAFQFKKICGKVHKCDKKFIKMHRNVKKMHTNAYKMRTKCT